MGRLKKLVRIFLSLSIVATLVVNGTVIVHGDSQDDITIIKTRLKDYFLGLDTIDDGAKVETCYVSKAQEYLAMLNSDGSFSDVDYKAQESAANGKAWSPYLALDRMQAIAIAYHKEGNALYHNEDAVQGLNKALLYWQSQDPTSTNWWERDVGIHLRFGRIGVFMEGIISPQANQVLVNKLRVDGVKNGTGQNNLWFDQNAIYRALITNDANKLKSTITDCLNYCLSLQLDDVTKEAVQVDNSLYFHGRQFYSNGYGMSMFRDMSFWLYMLRDTQFAVSQEVVDRMADYMLEGTRWTIRKDIMELYLGYRPYKYDVGYENYAQEYIEPLKRMVAVDPVHAQDYQNVLDNITGENETNGRNGNYYMWRSGYASHMRDTYGVNIKMDSKELLGGEWRGTWPNGNNKGQLIYWTSAASSTVVVDGDEYTSVYPTFDWRHTPGATAPNSLSGRYTFENNESFNIGVSNGQYGATAYKFDKLNTKGQKGYFFFDDEFVALGSNISSTYANDIHTTLNQSKASDLKVDGQAIPQGTKGQKYNAKSIYNNQVGYVFLENSDVYVSNTTQNDVPSLWPEDMKETVPATFTAWIDHGQKPTNASYSYIVVPGKSEAAVEEYSKNIPISVVANNELVQAVRHDGLKQTQINFYEAGELEYKPGYTVSVDKPCSIIIDESTGTRLITVALRDKDEKQQVNVKLMYGETITNTAFNTKGMPYAGQSMTFDEGNDFKYNASSYSEGHTPANTMDENIDSYWESQTNNSEWLSAYVGTNSRIKNMKITWGDHFAKKYEVYGSKDGVQYEKVASVNNGDGGEDILAINNVYQFIKIQMLESNNSNYQIKEIHFEKQQNVSQNRPVEVSSISTQAPTFVGKLAVDGDYSSRWASLRNSNDEWIVIDLEKYTKIESILINWEGACSDQYAIEVSQDGKRWQSAKENLKANTSLKDVIDFENGAYGRYVRLRSTKSKSPQYGISIYEIDVYGEYVSEPPSEIAYLRNAFASSINSSNLPTNVTDGKENTYWQSQSGDNEWLYIELKNTYQIYDIDIKWLEAYATSYDIEVSNDAKNWQVIKEINESGTGGHDTFTGFEDVQCKYIRFNLKK